MIIRPDPSTRVSDEYHPEAFDEKALREWLPAGVEPDDPMHDPHPFPMEMAMTWRMAWMLKHIKTDLSSAILNPPPQVSGILDEIEGWDEDKKVHVIRVGLNTRLSDDDEAWDALNRWVRKLKNAREMEKKMPVRIFWVHPPIMA
jgi:hypothetical protein